MTLFNQVHNKTANEANTNLTAHPLVLHYCSLGAKVIDDFLIPSNDIMSSMAMKRWLNNAYEDFYDLKNLNAKIIQDSTSSNPTQKIIAKFQKKNLFLLNKNIKEDPVLYKQGVLLKYEQTFFMIYFHEYLVKNIDQNATKTHFNQIINKQMIPAFVATIAPNINTEQLNTHGFETIVANTYGLDTTLVSCMTQSFLQSANLPCIFNRIYLNPYFDQSGKLGFSNTPFEVPFQFNLANNPEQFANIQKAFFNLTPDQFILESTPERGYQQSQQSPLMHLLRDQETTHFFFYPKLLAEKNKINAQQTRLTELAVKLTHKIKTFLSNTQQNTPDTSIPASLQFLFQQPKTHKPVSEITTFTPDQMQAASKCHFTVYRANSPYAKLIIENDHARLELRSLYDKPFETPNSHTDLHPSLLHIKEHFNPNVLKLTTKELNGTTYEQFFNFVEIFDWLLNYHGTLNFSQRENNKRLEQFYRPLFKTIELYAMRIKEAHIDFNLLPASTIGQPSTKKHKHDLIHGWEYNHFVHQIIQNQMMPLIYQKDPFFDINTFEPFFQHYLLSQTLNQSGTQNKDTLASKKPLHL